MNGFSINSKEIANFIKILDSENSIIFTARKAIESIAFRVKLKEVKMIYLYKGKNHQLYLYNDNNIENDKELIEFEKSMLEGKTKIIFYRKKEDGLWTEEEKETLNIIFSILKTNIENMNLYNDIREIKKTDVATGLPNLTILDEYFSSIEDFSKCKDNAIILFNIKNFKLINKKYGYKKGTEILIAIWKHLKSKLSDNEIIVKVTGDNFIAYIEKDNIDNFIDELKSISIKINLEYESTIEYIFNCKIIAYIFSGREENIYEVKEGIATSFSLGRHFEEQDIIYINEETNEMLMRKKEIERYLECSLSEENLLVMYQPKVNLETYEIIGAEALLRLKYKDEILQPHEFILICEKNLLIIDIDFMVLESVCRTIRHWIDSGMIPVAVSVNFSKKHFERDNTGEKIISVIEKYSIPKEYLEIEFTETAYIEGYDKLISTLVQLKEYGLKTSIDDFGIGYSSISLLQDLEFDVLKLDKSFLTNNENKRNRIICENIVKMSKELSMDVISEGVETEQDVQFLKSIGCNKAQGFLFDKPLKVGEFEKRIRKINNYKLTENN